MAEDCLEAYKNPSCPYVTQININSACMKQVDKALISLLGKDGTGLNDGVIHRMLQKLDDLEAKNKVTRRSGSLTFSFKYKPQTHKSLCSLL